MTNQTAKEVFNRIWMHAGTAELVAALQAKGYFAQVYQGRQWLTGNMLKPFILSNASAEVMEACFDPAFSRWSNGKAEKVSVNTSDHCYKQFTEWKNQNASPAK